MLNFIVSPHLYDSVFEIGIIVHEIAAVRNEAAKGKKAKKRQEGRGKVLMAWRFSSNRIVLLPIILT
ncbi:hypothetical protein DB29_00861 [Shouchella clausii]|nr:hypothetical protein DB29_00861 [Shouchella clausii]